MQDEPLVVEVIDVIVLGSFPRGGVLTGGIPHPNHRLSKRIQEAPDVVSNEESEQLLRAVTEIEHQPISQQSRRIALEGAQPLDSFKVVQRSLQR